MRRVLLAGLLLVLVAPLPPLSRAASGSGCLVDIEVRNTWSRLGARGPVAMDDTDPCHLLGVRSGSTYTSDDGGLTSRVVGRPPTEPARLVAEGQPPGHVLLLGRDGALWRTTDRGRSWDQATGLDGPVRDVSVSEQSPQRLLAVVVPKSALPSLPVAPPVTPGTGLYASSDGGASFTEVAGAVGLPVTSAVVDAGQPSRWWLGAAGAAGGLFVSEDAGSTFTPVSTGSVTGLATSRLAGGGSELVAATTDGLLVTRDGGRSVVRHLKGSALTGLALEWQHPSAAMLLGDRLRRTSNTGVSAREQAAGLPRDCRPSFLRRDRSVPSVFLVDCVDATTWRYRSDGTDLTATDMPDGSGGSLAPPLGGPQPVRMRELARHRLPVPGSRQDGSIASDGQVLYYADQAHKGLVHRVVARTGAELPDLSTGLKHPVGHLAYDATRDHLLMLDVALVVWDLPLSGGRPVKLFHAPLTGYSEEEDEQASKQGAGPFYGAMSYDSATDRMLFANDGSDAFSEYDRTGHLRHDCPQLHLQDVVRLGGNPAYEASIAGMVATGDGLVYVEAEDDSTVIRIDRSCRVLATFEHEHFSEAPAENDGIACDTTTFDTPAIWLRDAEKGLVVAYSVDAGYCALPSTVSVHAPPGVATGEAGRVCSRLRLTAKGTPLVGQRVDLLVAGRGIGSPITDRKGRACATYRPLPREAGAGAGTSRARQPVLAAFLGTPAYRPSTARASLLVSRVAVRPPPPPPAPPAVEMPALVPPPPPPPLQPPVQPPAQPPQPPPPAGQQQPVLQGHPGAQPGAMGQVAGAAVPEDEVEAATEGGDTHLAVGVDWEAYALPTAFGVAAFAAALRRRRASRVRSQSA